MPGFELTILSFGVSRKTIRVLHIRFNKHVQKEDYISEGFRHTESDFAFLFDIK